MGIMTRVFFVLFFSEFFRNTGICFFVQKGNLSPHRATLPGLPGVSVLKRLLSKRKGPIDKHFRQNFRHKTAFSLKNS
jgi:hypothetical protein